MRFCSSVSASVPLARSIWRCAHCLAWEALARSVADGSEATGLAAAGAAGPAAGRTDAVARTLSMSDPQQPHRASAVEHTVAINVARILRAPAWNAALPDSRGQV